MSDWATTLAGIRRKCWDVLEAGVADAASPARRPALASVGLAGDARVRIVVLRGADSAAGLVEVHTDLASEKVAELRRTPRAALLFWMPQDALQIRLSVKMQVLSGDDVAAIWAQVPQGGRMNYGGHPAPGTALADPADHDTTPDACRFAVLRGQITAFEALHLGKDLHRRAQFDVRDDFTGAWVAP